jgi:hypothetical protein
MFFRIIVLNLILLCNGIPLLADKSWSRESIKTVQTGLNDLGYTVGPADGLWGRKSASNLVLFCEEYKIDCALEEGEMVAAITLSADDSYLDVLMDHASAVWFENRIGYGAPKGRVDRYLGLTRREAIDLAVTELEKYEDAYELPSWFVGMKPLGQIIETEDGRTCNFTYLKTSLQSRWLETLYKSEVPQFDRLSTFWLDHFSVGYDAYVHPHAFARHTNIVRNWRNGSFLDLLYASLSDPGIIVYLNNDKSDQNSPNENLAREFFELFALGEGNYTESDVREFARLLTGRAFNTANEDYEFMSERAIQPRATILGKAHTSTRALVDSLKNHSAYGDYIIKKLYTEFVELSEPLAKDLRKLKGEFIEHESSLVELFSAIISSEPFWALDGKLTLIKSPLELFAGTTRTLNSTGSMPANYIYWLGVAPILESFDQAIFDPVSIDGWPTGKEWLQGQVLDRRAERIAKLYASEVSLDYFSPPVGSEMADHYWSNIVYNLKRKSALDAFFASAKSGQLLIEDLVVKADKFNSNRYSRISLTFKNVRFNGKIFDQITIQLNADPNNKYPDWFRNVQVWRETVSNGFLSGLILKSNGDQVLLSIKLPLTGSDKNYSTMSTLQKQVLTRLVQASSILISDKNYLRNISSDWQQWLDLLLKASSGAVDLYNSNSPVRLFQPPPKNNFSQITFNCNYEMGAEQTFLTSFFEYGRLRAISGREKIISKALTKDDYDPEVLEPFAEALGKLWLQQDVLDPNKRSAYLMPKAAGQDWQSVITSVEYNLR